MLCRAKEDFRKASVVYFAWALNAINEDLARRRQARRARRKGGARGDSEPDSDVPDSPRAGSPAAVAAAALANANAQQAGDDEPKSFVGRLTSALADASEYLPAYEDLPSFDTFSRVLFMILAVFLVLHVSSISTSLTVMNSQFSTLQTTLDRLNDRLDALDAQSLPPGSVEQLHQEVMTHETLVHQHHAATVEPLLHAAGMDPVFDGSDGDVTGADERVQYGPHDDAEDSDR